MGTNNLLTALTNDQAILTGYNITHRREPGVLVQEINIEESRLWVGATQAACIAKALEFNALSYQLTRGCGQYQYNKENSFRINEDTRQVKAYTLEVNISRNIIFTQDSTAPWTCTISPLVGPVTFPATVTVTMPVSGADYRLYYFVHEILGLTATDVIGETAGNTVSLPVTQPSHVVAFAYQISTQKCGRLTYGRYWES